jgi:UPF0716 family protein affecting phage T7 exclusion
MARLLVLGALAALTVAEVAAVLALVSWVGPATTIIVLGLDMLLGVLVMRWAVRGAPERRGWRLASGSFIALPGLVLDLVGVALLLPGVQGWLQERVLRGTESMLRRSGLTVVTVSDPSGARRTTVAPVDVIPGEVVDLGEPQPGTPERADEASDTGPRVVRGEILGPDDEGQAPAGGPTA